MTAGIAGMLPFATAFGLAAPAFGTPALRTGGVADPFATTAANGYKGAADDDDDDDEAADPFAITVSALPVTPLLAALFPFALPPPCPRAPFPLPLRTMVQDRTGELSPPLSQMGLPALP